MLIRLHLIADSQSAADRLQAIVADLDVVVSVALETGDFWDRVTSEPSDIILMSRELLLDPIGETVPTICTMAEAPDVVIVSQKEDAVDRTQLLAAGCTAVLTAELPDQLIREALSSFIERRREFNQGRVEREITQSEYSLTDFDSSSAVMKNFMRMVRRVVEPDSSLLILGETGVGKERLARAIHSASPRASGPFVPVNCAAFPETLLAGELFGYEEGAFTGASGNRRGYFEMAHGGTIFLDEIGELHQHLQVKLLRVLQERRIQPLGSEQEIEIDVRIFAATNRDLEVEIAQRRFRRDLYYRLGVVTLEIPPLREHPEDVPGLILRYLSELSARMNRNVATVSPAAMLALVNYRWPGNIRELINVVERAVILCEGTELTVDMLPRGFEPSLMQNHLDIPVEQFLPIAPGWKTRPWDSVRTEIMESIERRYLHEHLIACHGRLSEVSRQTGIKSRTLFEMLKRLNIDKHDFRRGRDGTPQK